MMAVKDQILQELEGIEDETFLASLLNLLKNVDKSGKVILPEEIRRDIDDSITEIENGQYSSHEEVMKRIKR